MLRWGYKKTTVDDIARLAGVAKGTIYLHWKTREELFLTLITREKLRNGLHVQQEMARDPEGVTLHGIIKHSLLATLRNPLFKAIFTRDREMLGELVEDKYHGVDFTRQFAVFYHFLTYMREHGLMRSDHSIEEQIHILQSILIGFMTAEQYMP